MSNIVGSSHSSWQDITAISGKAFLIAGISLYQRFMSRTPFLVAVTPSIAQISSWVSRS